MISALEQFSASAFSFCLFNFNQVYVDEVSSVVHIESFSMFIDQCLIECKHLLAVLCYFFLSQSFSRQILKENL